MSARDPLPTLDHALLEVTGGDDSDPAVAMLLQCLRVLKLHLVVAEQTSADAVSAITERLMAVQHRCDRLQAEVDAVAQRMHPAGDSALSNGMDAAAQEVRDHILETLGQMQFQDITRQMLDQVHGGLGQLGEHCTALAHGNRPSGGPGTVAALQALLAQWESQYVMGCQRLSHHQALGQSAVPDTEQVPPAPRIQLF